MAANERSTRKPLDEESVQRRTALFNEYVCPHLNLVYKLCIKYSYSPSDIEDNYNEVLINFFKYIETYDPSRPIQAWLHIITKRFVGDRNVKRNSFKCTEDVDVSQIADSFTGEGQMDVCPDTGNYHLLYSDEVLGALEQIKPIYREALLLQQAGYKLHEIMEIAYRNGSLRIKNIDTIKSRLFLAKQQMRQLIDRDGKTRTN